MLRIISKLLLIVLLSYPIMAEVLAGDYYHPSEEAMAPTFNQALPAAAGQHHYKATTRLQWSVGAAFADEGSAVSFGLGQQLGEVFAAGSYSTDGDNSIFNITGSGTF